MAEAAAAAAAVAAGVEQEPNESKDSPFERAIKVWTEIGLTTLQRQLDDEGTKIVDNQTTSLVGRKELAAKTKAFRKLPDDEKLVEVKALLKLYQTEIDNLTNRGKFAETCFMNVYKLLAEAPDPKPLLEASIDSVMSASEMSRLMAENARLNDLVSRHADYDSIKSRLMKLEIQSIETAQAKVKAKETEMKAIFDEQERNWKLREEELEEQIKDLKENHDVAAARLTARETSESGSRLEELELVARDLERANRKVAQVEKRNVELRTEIESIKSGSKEREQHEQYEKRLGDMETENLMVAAKLKTLSATVDRERASNSKRIEVLERDNSRKQQEIDNLKDRLRSQQDYDEVKRELNVLKSIELEDNDEEEEEGGDEKNGGDAKPAANGKNTQQKDLEKLLLTRNKKLTSDLTELRVANNDLKQAVDKCQKQLDDTTRDLKEARDLNAQLEEDLVSMRSSGNGQSSPTASMVSGWNSAAWGPTSTTGRQSPTSSIIGGREGRDGNQTLRDMRAPSVASSGDSSILPIITQQRDRFRQRNGELEAELRKNWSLVQSLQKEIEAVKKDNVELYEKTRYVSSYNSRTNNNAEDKYRSVYEEGLTPFQQFRGRETERVLNKMGPLERIAYSFIRIVLANRLSRNMFLVYCVGLHVLVMVILTYGVHSTATVTVTSAPVAEPGF